MPTFLRQNKKMDEDLDRFEGKENRIVKEASA